MDPALRNSCLRAPLGRAVWLAKYKELWLFKPILWKVKVPLCWRKPGIWANIVATLLSLLLKPLSLLSSSQINYCNHLFILVSSFALSSHQHSAQVLVCPQRVPLWTISWSLIELYFTSVSFMLFCLSPDPSVTVLLHIVRMLNAFFQHLCPHSVSWPLLCCSVLQGCWDKKAGTEHISFTLFLGDHLFQETCSIDLTYLCSVV